MASRVHPARLSHRKNLQKTGRTALRGLSVSTLVDDLCHEIYPGHHITYTLHEQQLYRARGYLEETIGLTFSPAITIAEGIANWACEMLFSPAELEAWLAEYIYPELGIVPDGADVTKLQ